MGESVGDGLRIIALRTWSVTHQQTITQPRCVQAPQPEKDYPVVIAIDFGTCLASLLPSPSVFWSYVVCFDIPPTHLVTFHRPPCSLWLFVPTFPLLYRNNILWRRLCSQSRWRSPTISLNGRPTLSLRPLNDIWIHDTSRLALV